MRFLGQQKIVTALVLLAWLNLPAPAWAQMPGGGGAPGLDAGLVRLFGKSTNFTARAEVRLLAKDRRESLSLTLNMAMLGQRIRTELDMARVKSRDFAASDLAQIKQLGLDQLVTILQPDRHATLYLYPHLRGYVELPLPREAVPAISIQPLGKETVGGRKCVKNKITLSGTPQQQLEATVWNAADLRDFPVKMEIRQPDAIVVLEYRDIRLTSPAADQFEPPKDYSRHESIEALALKRLLKGGQ